MPDSYLFRLLWVQTAPTGPTNPYVSDIYFSNGWVCQSDRARKLVGLLCDHVNHPAITFYGIFSSGLLLDRGGTKANGECDLDPQSGLYLLTHFHHPAPAPTVPFPQPDLALGSRCRLFILVGMDTSLIGLCHGANACAYTLRLFGVITARCLETV